VQRFRLKTIEVEAVQVDIENLDEVWRFLSNHIYETEMNPEVGLRIIIPNRHIEMTEGPEVSYVAKHGDWIVKQTEGIFHVISPKSFPRIYELVDIFHKSDPCIYCGIPHDEVPVGPCLGSQSPPEVEGDNSVA